MFVPTATRLPRSGPTSGDEDRFRASETQGSSGPLRGTNARSASAGPDDGLTDFDGAGEILRTWGAPGSGPTRT
jgi:hypothetical protein